jgi:hypothetical protein
LKFSSVDEDTIVGADLHSKADDDGHHKKKKKKKSLLLIYLNLLYFQGERYFQPLNLKILFLFFSLPTILDFFFWVGGDVMMIL